MSEQSDENASFPVEKRDLPQLRYSRRRFLKLAGGGAAATAAALLLNKLDPLRSTEESPEYQDAPEVIALRKRLEKKFNVKLATTKELVREFPDVYGGFSDYRAYSSEYHSWNNSNLAFLEKALSALPAHFLQTDAEGRRPMIILSPALGFCCGNLHHYPYAVEVNLINASPDLPNQDLWMYFRRVLHEFIHLNTLRYERGIDKGYLPREEYVQKLEQVLGAKFSEVQPKLFEQVNTYLQPLVEEELQKSLGLARIGEKWAKGVVYDFIPDDKRREGLTEEERESFEFYNRFRFVVHPWRDTISELLADMGEDYVRGETYFKQYYGEFFEPEIVERLYGFARDDIFRGARYEDGKIILPGV